MSESKDFSFAGTLMTIVIGLVLIVGLAFLGAWLTAYAVNYLFTPVLLTYVFGVAKITYWQAFALNVLSGWLFKSHSTSSK